MAVPLDPTHRTPSAPPAPLPAARAGFGVTDLQLLLMALIWGVNFSVVKYGAGALAPLAYNGIRVALAAVALLVIASFAREAWPRGRDLAVLLGLGLLGNGLYQLFFIEGVARTRAGTAALVLAAGPAFIALLGRLRGTERIRPIGMFGIALSIFGVALVLFGNARQAGEGASSLLGALLVLCGCLCWAIYTVFLQPYTHRYGGLALSAVTMAAGALPLVLIGMPDILATDFAAVPTGAWGAVAYSGLLALVVAYYLWYRGVRILGPTRTAMYANLQPAIALLVAWVTLGEVPTIWQVVGMTLVGAGVVLTRR
jgi:drug/metabolite transporter (DMT)-like permease